MAIHKKYKDKGLVSIAVNVDNLNYVPSSTVLSHVKNMALSYTVLLDDQAQAMEVFKVINIPVTFFINDKGIITYISYGEEDLLSPENRSRIEEITKQ